MIVYKYRVESIDGDLAYFEGVDPAGFTKLETGQAAGEIMYSRDGKHWSTKRPKKSGARMIRVCDRCLKPIKDPGAYLCLDCQADLFKRSVAARSRKTKRRAVTQ